MAVTTFLREFEYMISKYEELNTLSNAGNDRQRCFLLVDDDPVCLRNMMSWLQNFYQVAVAKSGAACLAFLGKNKPDLILLDYEMPVTTGPQVLEMLRSDPSTASIPVMFLTNKSDRTSVLAAVDLKPEKYLLKTMKPMEVLKSINEYFETEKAKSY